MFCRGRPSCVGHQQTCGFGCPAVRWKCSEVVRAKYSLQMCRRKLPQRLEARRTGPDPVRSSWQQGLLPLRQGCWAHERWLGRTSVRARKMRQLPVARPGGSTLPGKVATSAPVCAPAANCGGGPAASGRATLARGFFVPGPTAAREASHHRSKPPIMALPGARSDQLDEHQLQSSSLVAALPRTATLVEMCGENVLEVSKIHTWRCLNHTGA